MKTNLHYATLYEYVKNGYEKGYVKIKKNKFGCKGICCQIGNSAFFFDAGNPERFKKVKDYLKTVKKKDLYEAITKSIIEIHVLLDKNEDNGEAIYYYRYLRNIWKGYDPDKRNNEEYTPVKNAGVLNL